MPRLISFIIKKYTDKIAGTKKNQENKGEK